MNKFIKLFSLTFALIGIASSNILATQNPNTQKPQPFSCVIKYWSVNILSGTKGVPGWFICFYDKKGKQINSYRYDKENHKICTLSETDKEFDFDESNPQKIDFNFPLDLSKLKKIKIEPKPNQPKKKCAKIKLKK